MAKVKSRRPGPYVQQPNGVEMSEALRRQSDIQIGQLIQEVRGVVSTLTNMQAGMTDMQSDIKALQAYMNTNKGFASGFSKGFQFAALLGAGSLGAALVKAFDFMAGK